LPFEVRCTSGFFSGVGVAARITFSEIPFWTFLWISPREVVELFTLYMLVPLSLVLAMSRFFDVFDILDSSCIFWTSLDFLVIGPFFEAARIR
jgi:hypothetical protein